MNKQYYETIAELEKMGVDEEYIRGWACGFLRSPKKEEQRVSDGWLAGYEDGLEKGVGGG